MHQNDNNDKLPYGSTVPEYYDKHWMPALAIYLGINPNGDNWDRKKWWSDVHPTIFPNGPFAEAIYCPTGYRNSKDPWSDYYGTYSAHYGDSVLARILHEMWLD